MNSGIIKGECDRYGSLACYLPIEESEMKWIVTILIILLATSLGCGVLFTNEDRGGGGPNGPGGGGGDDTDDDAADDDATDDDIQEVSAALVYASPYSNIPNAFKQWGSDFYLTIDTYQAMDITDVDLSKYDIVILAEDLDLDNYYTAFEYIQEAHRPIFAMYLGTTYLNVEGGHWYTYESDPPENCFVYDPSKNIYLWNTGDDVFSQPWPIEIPEGDIIQLTLTAKYSNACNDWNRPTDIVSIGAIGNDQHFIAIGYENDTGIAFWGFDGTPLELTQDGQRLLANMIYHIQTKAK